MIIATAGHVDHGKTSLVKALTGIDADRLPEEKRRGMTIDLGFAYLPVEGGRTIGFVDVPGHERFVHNMLAGVTGIDCALLVVAADDGPMPQTREHLAILDLLGIAVGAVALTKIDMVDAARVELVIAEIGELLAPTALAGAPVFPVSAVSGTGVAALLAHLLHIGQARQTRAAGGLFRMTVDRSFTLAGAGTVVTGTVLAGSVKVGDQVSALLADLPARVRGLHAQNRAAQAASAGDRCALNLTGNAVAHASIARGDVVATPGAAPPALRIDIHLRVLPGEARALRHWTPVHVHLGAANVTGRVALLEQDAIEAGKDGLAQLVLDHALAACHGDAVILRDQSARRTVAGGRVIDVFAPPRGRARPARLAYVHAMAHADADAALAGVLAASPDGLDLARFAACRNLDVGALEALLKATPLRLVGADIGFDVAHWASARQAALAAVTAWHARQPESPGPPEERIVEGSGRRLVRVSIAALAQELVSEGLLERAGAALRLAGRRNDLNPADSALWERIRKEMHGGAKAAPTCAELSLSMREPQKRIKDLLLRQAKARLAWHIANDRFMLPAMVHTLAAHASALGGPERKERFPATAFRDRSGLGRNLAIEVLEFFDRSKFTRRLGEVRLVMVAPETIFGPPESA